MVTGEMTSIERIQELETENRALKEEVRQLKAENRRWARLVGTDTLTGLPNKISFMRALIPQAVQRAIKDKAPIGFILLSADDLGSINETHGRQAGDRVVKGLAEVLQSLLGSEGRLGHIDGAHFAAILYPADLDVVRGRANMLRARIRAHEFECADTTAQITVSAGITSVQPPGDADGRALGEEVFRLLNRSLHLAKKAGGNRVELVRAQDSIGEDAPG